MPDEVTRKVTYDLRIDQTNAKVELLDTGAADRQLEAVKNRANDATRSLNDLGERGTRNLGRTKESADRLAEALGRLGRENAFIVSLSDSLRLGGGFLQIAVELSPWLLRLAAGYGAVRVATDAYAASQARATVETLKQTAAAQAAGPATSTLATLQRTLQREIDNVRNAIANSQRVLAAADPGAMGSRVISAANENRTARLIQLTEHLNDVEAQLGRTERGRIDSMAALIAGTESTEAATASATTAVTGFGLASAVAVTSVGLLVAGLIGMELHYRETTATINQTKDSVEDLNKVWDEQAKIREKLLRLAVAEREPGEKRAQAEFELNLATAPDLETRNQLREEEAARRDQARQATLSAQQKTVQQEIDQKEQTIKNLQTQLDDLKTQRPTATSFKYRQAAETLNLTESGRAQYLRIAQELETRGYTEDGPNGRLEDPETLARINQAVQVRIRLSREAAELARARQQAELEQARINEEMLTAIIVLREAAVREIANNPAMADELARLRQELERLRDLQEQAREKLAAGQQGF